VPSKSAWSLPCSRARSTMAKMSGRPWRVRRRRGRWPRPHLAQGLG
jgi:hypothetical protein